MKDGDSLRHTDYKIAKFLGYDPHFSRHNKQEPPDKGLIITGITGVFRGLRNPKVLIVFSIRHLTEQIDEHRIPNALRTPI